MTGRVVPHLFRNRSGAIDLGELDDDFAYLCAQVDMIQAAILKVGPVIYTTTQRTLANAWQKVATLDVTTLALIVADTAVEPAAFDLFWTVVPHNATAPVDGVVFGAPVDRVEKFANGVPVGDLYMRSVLGATTTIMTGIGA